METLIFNNERKLKTENFARIGDLSYFEGPLLSLFEDLTNGNFYLFDWVDRDQDYNRWIIYRVLPKHLLNFLNRKISHLELFRQRPEKSVYFTDIDFENKGYFYYGAYEIESFPKNYFPNEDSYFDPEDCNSIDRIKSIIFNSFARQKSENEYSKVYHIHNLKTKTNYCNQPIGRRSKRTTSVNKLFKAIKFEDLKNSPSFDYYSKEIKLYPDLRNPVQANIKEDENKYS